MISNFRQIMVEAIALLAAMIAVAVWGCQAAAQDNQATESPFTLVVHEDVARVESVPDWARSHSGEQDPVRPGFQEGFADALTKAGEISRQQNKTVTLLVAPSVHDITELVIPRHVSVIADPPVARSARLRAVGGDNKTWITFSPDSHASTLAGFELVDKSGVASGCVAINTNKSDNTRLSDLRVVQKGVDTIGLLIQGQESIYVERCEFRASVPIKYAGGDNCVVSHSDLGASGNVSQYPSTVVWITHNPHQLVFDGSFTAQGGDHLFFGVTDNKVTGQNLTIYNCRWEQSTSLNDPGKHGIDITCRNRAFENLTMIGCRWTVRKAGVKLRYNPQYPLIPRFETVGCWLQVKNE